METATKRRERTLPSFLEAKNDYFEQVADQVDAAVSAVRDMTHTLSSLYHDATGLDPKPSILEGLLLEAYEKTPNADYSAQVERMLAERPFIAQRIKDRVALQNPLFSQPSILLAYLDIACRGRSALKSWPLTPEEMEPLLNDLGESHH